MSKPKGVCPVCSESCCTDEKRATYYLGGHEYETASLIICPHFHHGKPCQGRGMAPSRIVRHKTEDPTVIKCEPLCPWCGDLVDRDTVPPSRQANPAVRRCSRCGAPTKWVSPVVEVSR